MTKLRRSDAGYMLLEVVIAVALVSISLVFLSSRVAMAIQGSRVSEERAVATRLAQGGAEWLKGWRDDVGWVAFLGSSYTNLPSNGSTRTLCWGKNMSPYTEPFTQAQFSSSLGNCNQLDYIDGLYSREIKLKRSVDGSVIEYQVNVSWQSGRKARSVVLEGELKQLNL